MNQIQIKRAAISDASVISLLGRETFTETFGDIFGADELSEYLDKTFNVNKLKTSLSKDKNVYGILYYLDLPVGYYKIKLGQHFDDSADADYVQLQKIYLLRNYLHLKLGKQMMSDILNLTEIKSCKMIWLVVLHTNFGAIGFYEHQGFEKLRKYHHRIGSHYLEYELMTKVIADESNNEL